MAADPLSIVFDTQPTSNLLGRLAVRLQGPRPLFEKIAPLLESQIKESWEKEAEPSGTPWPELARRTIREKQRLGYGDKPMLERRGLDGGGKGSLDVRILDNGIQVYISEIMEIHDRGTDNIPQRRFIPNGEEFLAYSDRQVQKTLEDFLNPTLGGFIKGELSRSAQILRGLF